MPVAIALSREGHVDGENQSLHSRGPGPLERVTQTFGPYGARYLSEHHPEIFGDRLFER
jgi:hypothetical protein